MPLRRSLVAILLAIGLLPGCGSDDSKTSEAVKAPSTAEFKNQLFQGGDPVKGFTSGSPVEVITGPEQYAVFSEGRWSPEDEPAKAERDSLKLIEQVGFEGGTSLQYTAKHDDQGAQHFIFAAVMAVRNSEKAAAEVADRVKAMATHPCPWACVQKSAPLKFPAESTAVGYSVLREVRPDGTPESAEDQWQVYVTWSNGRYVHLALMFDDAKGSNVDAFTSLIAEEARRTAAL